MTGETRAQARARKRAEAEQRNARTAPERRKAARRPCPSGKRAFATEHEARCELVGAAVDRNRGRNHRHEIRVYACPDCAHWHLTSKPDRNLSRGAA